MVAAQAKQPPGMCMWACSWRACINGHLPTGWPCSSASSWQPHTNTRPPHATVHTFACIHRLDVMGLTVGWALPMATSLACMVRSMLLTAAPSGAPWCSRCGAVRPHDMNWLQPDASRVASGQRTPDALSFLQMWCRQPVAMDPGQQHITERTEAMGSMAYTARIHTVHLPSPSDQLYLKPAGSTASGVP
jgi:hypothetical protein